MEHTEYLKNSFCTEGTDETYLSVTSTRYSESRCLNLEFSFFFQAHEYNSNSDSAVTSASSHKYSVSLLAVNISLPFCSVDSVVMSCFNMPLQTQRP